MIRTDDQNIRNSGFTLVELMVVLVILTIGLLPLALVQTRAQQDVFETGQFSNAVQIAQLQIAPVRRHSSPWWTKRG
ncbi:MAG: prepilin-type N-terminal cleavage/methylation domain-containing protein [Candidatus Krumholzibacteriota bacterium]|nr:prepilin-type N-terminal cleavage/methylation domain-containing protein [Candidatus Krumholzibacteriota bacterium]